MWPISRPSPWVGRAAELAALRSAVEDLRGEALAGSDPAWDVGWGMADQLTERLPLRVILDCLQVRPGSPDPRRARAAELLRSRQLSLPAGDDASGAGVEALVTLADELCAA